MRIHFRMTVRLRANYLRMTINNVFPRYRDDHDTLNYVKSQIEEKMNSSIHRASRLEEKIFSAVLKGDDLRKIHTKAIRSYTKRATGSNVIMAILIIMFYHIRCAKELAARGWIGRSTERTAIIDILVETCVTLRSLPQVYRARNNAMCSYNFFGRSTSEQAHMRKYTIVIIGLMALAAQRLLLDSAARRLNIYAC